MDNPPAMPHAKTQQPKDDLEASSLAYEIRIALVEQIRRYMHGESDQSDVLNLARQLTPEAERSGDFILASIVNELGKMHPGQLVNGFTVDYLIRTALNALQP